MPAALAKSRPAVYECAWTYETGRKCHRIAGRGQRFCPGHRRPVPRLEIGDDAAFSQELRDWIDQLVSMDLPTILYAVHCSLAKIEPILARKASRRSRLDFARASIAVWEGRDRLVSWLSHYPLPRPLQRGRVAAPPPSRPPLTNPESAALAQDPAALSRLAQSVPQQLSPDQLNALCDSLLNILNTP